MDLGTTLTDSSLGQGTQRDLRLAERERELEGSCTRYVDEAQARRGHGVVGEFDRCRSGNADDVVVTDSGQGDCDGLRDSVQREFASSVEFQLGTFGWRCRQRQGCSGKCGGRKL